MELSGLMSVLEQEFPITQISLHEQIDVRDARLLDGNTETFEPDVLYVGDFSQLGNATVPADTPLLLCGKVPRRFAVGHQCLSLFEAKSLYAIFNFVKDHCVQDALLTARLSRFLVMTGRENTLQDLVDEASRVIENPLILMDASFNLLAMPSLYPIETIPLHGSIVNGRFTDEFILHAFESDQAFNERIETNHEPAFGHNKPFLATCDEFDDRILASKLFANNKNVGILIMYPLSGPITERHMAQLSVISSVIAAAIEGQSGLRYMGTMKENLLAGILASKNSNELEETCSRTESILKGDIPDRMCAVAILPRNDSRKAAIPYMRLRLKSLLPHVQAVYYDRCLVLVIPLSASNVTLSPEDREVLEGYLEQETLTAGASNPFMNIRKLPQACSQALRALQYSSKRSNHPNLCWYCDYAFFDLLSQRSDGLMLDDLEHPVVTLLKVYDAEHETDMSRTLKAYLLSDKNVVECTKQLGLSRSSLYYRLNRIKQLTGVDIDDPDLSFDLMCSYRVQEFKRSPLGAAAARDELYDDGDVLVQALLDNMANSR